MLVATLTLALGASTAQASKGTVSTITAPATGLAVNEATGNLYAMEEGKVAVFDADGNPLFDFGSPGEGSGQFGTFPYTSGIAINQVSGDVYVFDLGNYRVQQFDAAGAFIRMWGVDVNATKPSTGFEVCAAGSGDSCKAGESSTAPGGFSASGINLPLYLNVDPGTGNVIVADGGNKRLQLFTSTGALAGVVGSATQFPENNSPSSVAVDSAGALFVAGFETAVQRFSSAGASLGDFGSAAARQIAIDPSDDRVYLTQANATTGEWEVAEYGHDGTLLEEHAIGIPAPTGLAVNSSTGRIYVSDNGGGQVILIDEVASQPLPIATAATEVTAGSATLNGTVNPNGSAYDTHWRFICTPACPGVAGGNAGNGTTEVPVSAVATGLDPNTTYQVRLVATREFGAGNAVSAAATFTTGAVAPGVSLVAASRVSDTSARLGASVNGGNSSTTYYFEFGTSAGYGSSAPAGKAGDAGKSLSPVPAFETITGLSPNTTYHFKVVAENGAGKAESGDVVFTTRSSAEVALPQRGIELVTPPDKGNQNPGGYLADDGERVIWGTKTGSPGAQLGQNSPFLAERTASGWVSRSLVPQAGDQIGGGERGYVLAGATGDYSKAIFQIGEDSLDGVEGDVYTFARFDPFTLQQQELANFPKGHFELGSNSLLTSADGARVFLTIRDVPQAGNPANLYDIGAGGRRLISVMPETGGPPACGVSPSAATRVLSRDGSRFYFMTQGENCFDPVQIYLRDDQGTQDPGDDTTTRVSTPPVAGPEDKSIALRTNASGSSLIYYSAARITADDDDEDPIGDAEIDLYRWTIGKGNECLTCDVPSAGLTVLEGLGETLRNVVISQDLSHVYLSSSSHLVPGKGDSDKTSLYLIANGEVRYISPGVESVNHHELAQTADLTADGRTLVFYSNASGITADDNRGNEQYYRYSEDEGSLECISCAQSGTTSGAVEIPAPPFIDLGSVPAQAEAHNLTVDGETYVFTTVAALVPEDANNGPDIYEWHNGGLQLITDGEGEYGGNVSMPLSLLGITADSTDILFKVSARLTGFERDDVGQIYVSRIGGGFTPPDPAAPCNEDACQGPLGAAPTFRQPGSAGLSGPGSVQESKPKLRAKPCKQGSRRVKVRKGPNKGKARCVKSKHAHKGKSRQAHKRQVPRGNGSGK